MSSKPGELAGPANGKIRPVTSVPFTDREKYILEHLDDPDLETKLARIKKQTVRDGRQARLAGLVCSSRSEQA